MSPRRKLLVISEIRYWNRIKGNSVRFRLLLEELLDDFEVDLFLPGELDSEDEAMIRQCSPRIGTVCGWKSAQVLPWDVIGAIRMTMRRDSSRPIAALPENLMDWRISLALRRQLDRKTYDVVLFEYIWTVKFLNAVTDPAMPPERWVDTHDVMHQRASSQRLAGMRVKKPITPEEEAGFLTPFSRIIAIQPEEAAEFSRLVPGKEIVTLPAVPQVDHSPYPPPRQILESPLNLVHVSSRGPIAVHSLRWFINEIWPSVLDRWPEARLHVIGSVCETFHHETILGIFPHGYVENLAPFYQHADLIVNPCLAGSGLKIKTVEALAYGCRVLTTRFGAQGLDPSSSDGLIVCDPPDFQAALGEIISGIAVKHHQPAHGFQPA